MRSKFTLLTTLLALIGLGLASCVPDIPEEPKKNLSVSLDATALTLEYGVQTDVKYSFKDADGNLKVDISGLPYEVSGTNEFLTGTSGKLIFISRLDKDETCKATVTFKDNSNTVTKTLTLNTKKQPIKVEIPSAPVFEPEYAIVYPYSTNQTTNISFTIPGEQPVDELTVLGGSDLDITLEKNTGNKSGKIKIKAKENFNNESQFILNASNTAGTATKSVRVHEAFLNVIYAGTSATTIDVPGNGSEIQLGVSTNLKFDAAVSQESKDFIRIAINDNNIDVTVEKNNLTTTRSGKITVYDDKHILQKEIVINQEEKQDEPIEKGYESDRKALIAINKALKMDQWENNTSTDGKSNWYWNLDNPVETWFGTKWEEINGQKRCVSLVLADYKTIGEQELPKEIGWLSELKTIEIRFVDFARLDNAVKNLVKLKELILIGCNLEKIDINEWTGLKELVEKNNKLEEIDLKETKIHGTIPSWLNKIKDYNLYRCHFYGQVPDIVAKTEWWNTRTVLNLEILKKSPIFDQSKYELTPSGLSCYLTEGEVIIYTQQDNYALWVGEQPSNTKWVNDNLGGHWEWTE